jgi:TPR repeat protein
MQGAVVREMKPDIIEARADVRGRTPPMTVIGRLGAAIAVALLLAPPAEAARAACPEVEVSPGWVRAVQDARAADRYDELLRLYKEPVAAGDARMQADLGFLLEDGAGEFSSQEERAQTALALYRSAALCGDHLAIQRLALAYMQGELGLDADVALAACLYNIGPGGSTAAACGIGHGD